MNQSLRSWIGNDCRQHIIKIPISGGKPSEPAIAVLQPAARDNSNPGKPPHPRFAKALQFWLKLGFISFGGSGGQIAIMHQELVTRRKWISEARFLHALNYCMLLPGPEATSSLPFTSAGCCIRRGGGIVAGALFVLPSAVRALGAELYLRGLRASAAVDRRDLLRIEAGGDARIVASAVIRIGQNAPWKMK